MNNSKIKIKKSKKEYSIFDFLVWVSHEFTNDLSDFLIYIERLRCKFLLLNFYFLLLIFYHGKQIRNWH
jgi:hypothetical protein